MMYDLESFQQRVRGLYRSVSPYDDGRKPTLADLADAVGLNRSELGKRLNGTQGAKLTNENARAIVRALAEWGALSTRAEATALLALVGCPPFSAAEWRSPPLDLLTQPAISPDLPSLDNLPLALTSFVGRERELAECADLISQTRLLTLVGVGGVGKTRLALAVAARLAGSFADGVYLVELAQLRAPALVAQAIATGLWVREQQGEPLLATITQVLRGKELLLVLDNCEHLAEAAATIAYQLLSHCPRLRILATSRAMLAVAGETLFQVPPLRLPAPDANLSLRQLAAYPAVQLFVERSRAIQSQFQLTTATAAAVREVCRRLDGIPLALELAAALTGGLSVTQIAARLNNRFRLLRRQDPNAEPRQQTLYASLEWGYDLLSPTERLLFRRLAVFSAGWQLEAAEAICADLAAPNLQSDAILLTLISLVGKSLVQTSRDEEQTRYTMLETIREYAHEKLIASGEAEAMQRQHTHFYLSLAENAEPELRGAKQAEWLAHLEREHDNLRAALGWAVAQRESEIAQRLAGALWRFWWLRGYLSEGCNWLNQALSLGGDVPLAVQARALNAAGTLTQFQGNYAAAHPLYEQSLALWTALGDMQGAAFVLNNMGTLAVTEQDYSRARALYEQCIAALRASGDRRNLSAALSNLAEVVRIYKEYTTARTLYEESLAIDRELGNRMGVASLLNNLGNVVTEQGDYVAARRLLDESLNLRVEMMDRWSIPYSLEGLAALALAQGEGRRAASLLGAANALRREFKVPLLAAEQAAHATTLATLRTQVDDAAFALAWAEGEAMDWERMVAYALAGTGDA